MYESPSKWFACNYTMPKRINNRWFGDPWEPTGLEAQYERLVWGGLTAEEQIYYYGIRRSYCGYLGEILLAASINVYMSTFYPEDGLIARLSTWEEDADSKMDVVLFDGNSPDRKLGIQVKLTKNCQSRVNAIIPILGLKAGEMDLGIEDLMYYQGNDPPYLEKPGRYIRDRFGEDGHHFGHFMDALFTQTGRILDKARVGESIYDHPMSRALFALCGRNT